MNAAPLVVADIFRAHWQEYQAERPATPEEHRIAEACMRCHTAALGGHMMQCDSCGHQVASYNSCRNRHCPGCQGHKAAEWVEARRDELLPVGYFHVVFTLPHIFNELVLVNKSLMYDLLFQAVAKTLLQVGERNLGCRLGFFAVLHSWGQTLTLHPHLHVVLPGCGLSLDRARVIHFKERYFVSDRILSKVFRGKFIALLKRAYRRGELRAYFDDFNAFLNLAVSETWVVRTMPSFAGPEVVLKYLARYTHRVAISNRRLLSLKDGMVTFAYRDYRTSEDKQMSLQATEFIRRFLMHYLPKRFVRVRYYGFLTRAKRKAEFTRLRELLPTITTPKETETNPHRAHCPHCKAGFLVPIRELPTQIFRLSATRTLFPTAPPPVPLPS